MSTSVLGAPNDDGSFDCTWSREDFYATASCKKAISICIFLMFLAYTTMVLMRYKNGASHLGLKLHRMINEIAYSHPFFFIAAILVHVLTPLGFHVALIYFYAATMAL